MQTIIGVLWKVSCQTDWCGWHDIGFRLSCSVRRLPEMLVAVTDKFEAFILRECDVALSTGEREFWELWHVRNDVSC